MCSSDLAFKEERNRHTQRISNIPKPGGADTVHTGFILLDLLELDPNLIRQLLLRHANHPTTMTNALANMRVYRVLHNRLHFQCYLRRKL